MQEKRNRGNRMLYSGMWLQARCGGSALQERRVARVARRKCSALQERRVARAARCKSCALQGLRVAARSYTNFSVAARKSSPSYTNFFVVARKSSPSYTNFFVAARKSSPSYTKLSSAALSGRLGATLTAPRTMDAMLQVRRCWLASAGKSACKGGRRGGGE